MKMKSVTFLASLVLASAMPLFAQAPASTTPQADSGMQDSSHMKSGKKMTMTGCISEKDGKYMLMTKKHPDGMELMTTEDLKPHVGHTVKVTGTMANGSDKMSMMSIQMTSMKMVSSTCSMNMGKSMSQ
jgi:hypothetical protein